MQPQVHLDADTLAAYVDRRLAIGELGRVDQHIDACGSCRRELSVLAALQSEPPVELGEAPLGTLGRYELLREIGRGAMGIVMRAYDPELARAVAIKLVHGVDADTRELLRREARALAKLRHPNVVTVHDVVVDDDGLYVAMELVEGDTLRGYCRDKPLRAILAACVLAGRGLAAAHDAGVVHRDFKPENVLCGTTGEVKVGDFGLARAIDESPDGALCGTPAFMAPEVLSREPATAASDQYSFCVSVQQLLTGHAVPRWVARVLERGLAADPLRRFPSMHALVEALDDDPTTRRRRRGALAAGGLAAIALGAALTQLAASQPGAACSVDAGWDPAERQAVHARLILAADADAATRVVRALDQYVARWTASRTAACAAKDARTLACLDRSRRELDAFTATLLTADGVASRALEATAQLADPRSCDASFAALPDQPAQRVVAEHARTVLAQVNALVFAGDARGAGMLVDRLVPQVADVPVLRAEALYARARIAIDRGQHERAELLLFEALHAAELAHDDVLVATIWVDIVGTTGAQRQRFDLALSNARAADAALARITPSAELRMRYGYQFGALLLAHGQLDEARRRLEAVLPLGTGDPSRQLQLGLVELALCDVERQQNKVPAAKQRCTDGMARVEEALGPTHLKVAVSLSQVGAIAYTERDFDAAERIYTRAIDIFEQRGATEHFAYAQALSNLGAVFSERGHLLRASQLYRRSLAAFDAHPGHPQRLMPLQGLANIALRTGHPDEAIPHYEQIREARRAAFPAGHPAVLGAEFNLALAYQASKQPAKAEPLFVELAATALRPGNEAWMIGGRALDLAGQIALERGDRRVAIERFERAVDVLSKVSPPEHRDTALQHLGDARGDRR